MPFFFFFYDEYPRTSNIQPESQNILNNYQFSGDNYKSAWEALCRRFDDRRVLLMQYTNSLMTISDPRYLHQSSCSIQFDESYTRQIIGHDF